MDFKPYKMGKYLLLERLATGGMAEVYRAKATGASGFEKHLAIKRILPDHLEDDSFRKMFETEARIGSSLTHSNIVQILDFVKFGETFLLVMEFVNGKNLRQVINKLKKQQFTLPVECAIFIANETCKGLEYAHSKKDDFTGQPQNIIHRDMSPQNIMLSYDGLVKIVDFGIANWKDKLEQTKSGVIKGKFGYMSPEQAAGEPISNSTDIFSTGIIFWELLTGKRLFTAENDISTLKLIQDCVVPRPSQFNPKVTPDLERIVMKALSKNVSQRYQTAGAMQRQIQEHLNKHYPSFRENELASMMQRLFKEEIETEKRRIEVLSRQSIPFSQGKAEALEISESEFELEESISEGTLTASDQDRVSHITFIDEDGNSSAILEPEDVHSKTKETLEPKRAKETLSNTNPETEEAVPETIAKTVLARRPSPQTEAKASKTIPQKETTIPKFDNLKDKSIVVEAGGIKLETDFYSKEDSRESWSSQSYKKKIDTPFEEHSGIRFSGIAKVAAASSLIGITVYFYHLLLSGQAVIPVKVDAEEPRVISSPNPAPAPAPASPSKPAAINNCEIRFETDPPGALVVIDGVEKIYTPGTVLAPCDSSFNYSLQLKDYETVAENIVARAKMKPVSKALRKVERGDLVIITNRRVKVSSDTEEFGETEPGTPFRIERLPAGRRFTLHFINEVFGINQSEILEIKPGVSTTYNIKLGEKSEKR